MSYEVITLNGEDYIIVDTININNTEYLYVINEAEEKEDCTLLKRSAENGILMVESVIDEKEIEMVFETMAKGNV